MAHNYYSVENGSTAQFGGSPNPNSANYPPSSNPAMALRGGAGRRWYQTKWVKLGVPAVLAAVIVAAVVGGVEGSKSSDSSAKSNSGGIANAAAASRAAASTDSELQFTSLPSTSNIVADALGIMCFLDHQAMETQSMLLEPQLPLQPLPLPRPQSADSAQPTLLPGATVPPTTSTSEPITPSYSVPPAGGAVSPSRSPRMLTLPRGMLPSWATPLPTMT